MSTDTPSPASPAPTDRGDRMSTPTPSRDPRDWVGAKHAVRAFYASDRSATRCVGRVISYTDQPTVTVEMPDGSREDWLASLCEPTAEIRPAASAPQGDTADVIERAAKIAHDRQCGCFDYQEHADEDTSYVEMMGAVAAAGLLAVAASPATPQAAKAEGCWCQPPYPPWPQQGDDCPHCPDGHQDPRRVPWNVTVSPQRDGDGQPQQLTVCRTQGSHVAQSDAEWLWALIREHGGSAPAPADDEVAQVERMARAAFEAEAQREFEIDSAHYIAGNNRSAPVEPDTWDEVGQDTREDYRRTQRAALAALKEGQKA